jgi:putative polyhydroxyalkanoate system protein
MADIRIHRAHALGLPRAREIAWQWAEDVEAKFGMECTVYEGETSDTVEFTRSGVTGQLVVAADHFDLNAKLGFLLGAFRKTIEEEIQKNLDDLLAAEANVTKAKTPKAAAPSAGKESEPAARSKAAKSAGAGAKPGGRSGRG